MPLITCTAMVWKGWGHGFVFFQEITVKKYICIFLNFQLLVLISRFLIVLSIRQNSNYDIISVRHQRVVWMTTERVEIPALGASAYLLVCRRHATLLALCNTHSGRRGAGGVWVVLTVPSCRTTAVAAAAAQHVAPLDHIAACWAAIGPCPFPCPIGSTTCCHHCGPSPCCCSRLGHKHRDTCCSAGCHRDGQRCAGGGGLRTGSCLTFVIRGSSGLGVQGGVGVREGAGTTGWHTCKDSLQNQEAVGESVKTKTNNS